MRTTMLSEKVEPHRQDLPINDERHVHRKQLHLPWWSSTSPWRWRLERHVPHGLCYSIDSSRWWRCKASRRRGLKASARSWSTWRGRHESTTSRGRRSKLTGWRRWKAAHDSICFTLLSMLTKALCPIALPCFLTACQP